MQSSFFRSFILRYALVGLPVLVAVTLYAYSILNAELRTDREDKTHKVNALQIELNTVMNVARSDVLVLEQSQELKTYLFKPTLINEAILHYRFRNFLLAKPFYSQLRLLDMQGHEMVRVDRTEKDVVSILNDDLQDKSNRYYYHAVKDLNVGEVFISRLDLNIENNRIEYPWRPVIRFATPFADRFGNKAGILVANLNARSLLDEFKIMFNGDSSYMRMMNDDGYWVFHPDESKSFGFMTGTEKSLKGGDVEAWGFISKNLKGSISTKRGDYVFSTVNVLSDEAARFASKDDIDQWWKVMAFTPRQSMLSGVFEQFGWMIFFLPIYLIFSGIFSWSWAKSSYQNEIARQSQKRLINVIEQSSELIMITDAHANIEYVNPAFERVSGYSKEDVIGKNPRIVKSGKQDFSFYKNMWDNLSAGQDFTAIFINQRRDGGYYYEHKQITPVLNDKGEVIQYLSLGKDVTEQTELEKLAQQMRDFAFKDALTGVHNRASMNDLMLKGMLRTKRDETLMLVAFIDIDKFKTINDTHGHEMGDRCIKHVAEMLLLSTRETDSVFRLGGDEFVIMLEGFSHVDEMHTVLRKLIERIQPTVEMQKLNISLRISVGAMVFPFGDVHEIDAMISEADAAMYQSKMNGGHQYTFYEPWMKEGVGLAKLG